MLQHEQSVWYEYTQSFDATVMTHTVPGGELASGDVYDYLRLELNEEYKPEDHNEHNPI